MKTILLLMLLAAPVGAVILFILFFKSRIARAYRVSVQDIPRVLSELTAAKSTPAFAVFMFEKPGATDGDMVNVQFSLEDGKAGFDWMIIGYANVADQDRFVGFAEAAGYMPSPREKDGVKYLRVEGDGLARLCADVITKMYGRSETEPLSFIAQGFEWTP